MLLRHEAAALVPFLFIFPFPPNFLFFRDGPSCVQIRMAHDPFPLSPFTPRTHPLLPPSCQLPEIIEICEFLYHFLGAPPTITLATLTRQTDEVIFFKPEEGRRNLSHEGGGYWAVFQPMKPQLTFPFPSLYAPPSAASDHHQCPVGWNKRVLANRTGLQDQTPVG